MIKKITRKNLDKFLEFYATQKRVLDVGSGGSDYDRFFPNRFTIDLDPKRQPDMVADAEDLPFADQEFEIILCTEVLEHVKNPFKVEKEFWRILRPGGTLILTTRFIFPIHDAPNDFWRFTKYGLKNVFSRWWIIELREETQTFSALAALFQRVGFQTHLRINKISKFFIFLFAWMLDKMNGLVIKEFGNINKTLEEDTILTSGYYLVCQKPQ